MKLEDIMPFKVRITDGEITEEVELAPVKRGKWLIEGNPGIGWYQVTCSECGENVTSTVPVIGFFPNAKAIWDFCPWCGAKMDGDADV